MSKARTEDDLSYQLSADLTSRIRELSDLKTAIRTADSTAKNVLLKALVAIAYAHWEGHVKFAATKLFEFVAMRRLPYSSLEGQFYVNLFLVRLGAFGSNRPSLRGRAELVTEVLNSRESKFSRIHPDLVNTGSNLNFEVLQNICLVCGIDPKKFEEYETFIDVLLLKRRNSIAHGEDATVSVSEVDDLVSKVTTIMRIFLNEVQNKVYEGKYLAPN